MTIKEMNDLLHTYQINDCAYGVLDDEKNLRLIMAGQMTVDYIERSISDETDRNVKITAFEVSGDNFNITVMSQSRYEEDDSFDDYFTIHPVNVYSSEDVRAAVRTIQNILL